MQHYFFHMASKDHLLLDNLGRELHSLAAAHQYAVRLIFKSRAYMAPEDIEGWRINIADIASRVQLVVLFPRVYVSDNWRMLARSCAQERGDATPYSRPICDGPVECLANRRQ